MKTTTRQFKSIVVDESSNKSIHFRNPFSKDPYIQLASTTELCRYWTKENKIRQTELEIVRNNEYNE